MKKELSVGDRVVVTNPAGKKHRGTVEDVNHEEKRVKVIQDDQPHFGDPRYNWWPENFCKRLVRKKKSASVGDRVRITDVDRTDGNLVFDSGLVMTEKGDALFVRCDTWRNSSVVRVSTNRWEVGNWFFKDKCSKLTKGKKR